MAAIITDMVLPKGIIKRDKAMITDSLYSWILRIQAKSHNGFTRHSLPHVSQSDNAWRWR